MREPAEARSRLAALRGGGTGPLQGAVVADFTFNMAGPFCTMLLADMGAVVVKIEPPSGEPHRWMRAPEGGGMGPPWALVNRDKLSLSSDLKDAEDRASAVEPLLRIADIVVHNFKPTTAESLKIDARSIAALNPRAIHCSISGFGQSPLARDRAGVDIVAESFAGISSVTGFEEQGPAKVGVPLGDVGAGLIATIEILSRWNAHSSEDPKCSPDAAHVSLVDSMVAFGTFNLANAAVGVVPTFQGGEHQFMAPYGYFRAGEGWLALGLATDEHWKILCETLGHAELMTKPGNETIGSRHANRPELREDLQSALAPRSALAWEELLGARGVPCSALRTYDDVLHDPIFYESGVMKEVEHPDLGPFVALHPLSWGRQAFDTPAHRLGADRQQIVDALWTQS